MQNKKPPFPDFGAASGKIVVSSVITNMSDLGEESEVKTDDPVLILPVYDIVAVPMLPQPIKLTNELAAKTAETAYQKDSFVAVMPVISSDGEINKKSDFAKVGVIAKVAKIIKLPDGSQVAFINSFNRIVISKLVKKNNLLTTYVKNLPPIEEDTDHSPEMEMMLKDITNKYQQIISFLPEEEREPLNLSLEDPLNVLLKKIYSLIISIPINLEDKILLLQASQLYLLLFKLIQALDKSLQGLSLMANIHMKTHENLTSQQKELFLRQQLRTIQEELGVDEASDRTRLLQKAETKKWSKKAREFFEKELDKLERVPLQSPEYSIQLSYLETLLDLPWENYKKDSFSLSKVEKILDRDHFGLEKVKERILEQMAVIKLRKDMKAPIICLYGPPGVGKTSLGKSIAEAMGRDYVRISLGGLHDEAEIRGHRRTYIGAMPGRIIKSLAKSGTGNPVFMLDEVDKIRKDFKGDPSAALLEVLDPEQNIAFHDNFVDFDYDLSKVFFIATANDISEIAPALLDRMELIEINGYIPEEKIEIAIRHLVPKLLQENGFEKDEIKFHKEALRYVIDRYTRESGVRQLEKKISKILRKLAVLKASKKDYPKIIVENQIHDFLGIEEINRDFYKNNELPGVVTGLAWTQAGGEILYIESSLSPGKGDRLTLTGNLGDVMKESATIAFEYLKAHSKELGIPAEMFEKYNVHIHVPEGAVPKDGPSAGITLATSLASVFTGKKVRDNLAMTGELTLTGRVLAVGGIKEKILAAKRAGVTDIILSAENKRNIEEINPEYISGLNFHYVSNISELFPIAFQG